MRLARFASLFVATGLGLLAAGGIAMLQSPLPLAVLLLAHH